MSTEDKLSARGTAATVVATASITLAIGVTAAALGGYLVPNRGGGPPEIEQAAKSATVATAATPQPAPPSVVLVPVVPEPQREPPAATPRQPEPEMLVPAAYEPNGNYDDGDHVGRREHRDRQYEDDDDDDD